MAGWIHLFLWIIYVIVPDYISMICLHVCGFNDATISRSEDKYGFPFLEKHLKIGSAMLSLVRLYELTIHATTQTDCAANTQ